MKPRIRLGEATTPDGDTLELYEHDGHHEVVLNKRALMGSRMHNSEEDLARLACVDLPPKAKVLIGGLGVGFTLRAALDLLPEGGRAIQVELMEQVVEWNRDLMGHHADHPLADPRTKVVQGDVCEVIQRYDRVLSAIMLDIDNGPMPLVKKSNGWLYTPEGLRALHRALAPGGRVAIWSADDEPSFPKRMERAGLRPERHVSHARPGRKGTRHIIFVGRRPA